MPYIYKITNKVTGRAYIGQSWRLPKVRFYEHKRSVGKLGNAIRKYGYEGFILETIEVVNTHSQVKLDEREIFWITYFDCVNIGYNLKPGGSNGKHNKETCRKISKALKGKPLSQIHKQKISKSHKGIKFKVSPEKIRIGSKNPFYGKKHNEETLKKMSESHKQMSEETKRKIGMAVKNRIISDVTRNRLSLAAKKQWQRQKAVA